MSVDDLKRKMSAAPLSPFTLPPLSEGVVQMPDRILVYGPPGTGKTTFAASFPNALILDLEGGSLKLKNVVRDQVKSYRHLLARLESDLSRFQTIVIDTVDKLEDFIQEFVCEVNSWPNIEAPGYGKGYDKVNETLVELLCGPLTRLQEQGKTIILIGHTEPRTVPNPSGDDYLIYDLTCRKKFAPLIRDWCDVIGVTEREHTVSDAEKIMLSGRMMLRLHPDGCYAKARTEDDVATPKTIEMPRENPAKLFLDWRSGAKATAPAKAPTRAKKAAPIEAPPAPVASAEDLYESAKQLLLLCDDADGKMGAFIESNKDNPDLLQKGITRMKTIISTKKEGA